MICQNKTLYIIPARGGSKGIPQKNIKLLGGKPLVAYSIELARRFAADADICVTTDSIEITDVAASMGLRVPFIRPAALATDSCGTYEVLIHALDYYKSVGVEYDTVMLLQPTSPLRIKDDIVKVMERYTSDIDMVVTVTEAASNPYYNLFEIDSNGYLQISKGDGVFTRRQDIPKVWEYNGAVYMINVNSLRQMKLGEFRKRVMVEMPRERSIDLDTEVDWLIAEKLINR
ncbi:MAG: acylneuraminate cytidylyltransferase family protein [Bacteroidales bacterium]